MRITIMGSGYVGLVTGVYFADLGNDVICLDIDEDKITKLKDGILPIYEPGLGEMCEINAKAGRLVFSSDVEFSLKSAEIIFLAVGTPPGMNHEADISAVKACARDIGKYVKNYVVVVDKSTVPIGTSDIVEKIIKENQDEKINFGVVSNPEFLREGVALEDCKNPDRIVVGSKDKKALEIMRKLYDPIMKNGSPLIVTDVKSAELIKYASNAMLATRISFMNQLSHLCEKFGANTCEVARGMGLDSRIGPKFLEAGIGYGGSCFPKDVQALVQMLKDNNCDFDLFESVENINRRQKLNTVSKIKKHLDVKGRVVGILGIAFKADTDDIRESPSIEIIRQLAREGARLRIYDPEAMDNARIELADLNVVDFCENIYDTVKDSDVLLVATQWNVFKNMDFDKIKGLMKGNLIIDGRNIYEPSEIRKMGFDYESIGRV